MPTTKGTTVKKRVSRKTAVRKAAIKPAVRAAGRTRTTTVTTESMQQVPQAAHHASGAYVYAVGRRKSAVARVRIYKKNTAGTVTINGKPMSQYLPIQKHQDAVLTPFIVAGIPQTEVTIRVVGGGVRSQTDSIRHGVARALLKLDPAVRIPLKRAGLLTRDPRVKERKKYGLKRARRAPQWQKR